MTFKAYSKKSRNKIEDKFSSLFKEQRERDLPPLIKNSDALDLLQEFTTKGKLIRGTLFLLSVEMFGGKSDELVNFACAIELMHSALLIHDDIIDRDSKRRGADTIYYQYIKKGEMLKAQNPHHYGISMGIVAGDIAAFLSLSLIGECRKDYAGQLTKFFGDELYLVAQAQMLDSDFGQREVEPSLEDIYTVYKYKTARYTFSMPFVMGAISSGKDAATQELLGELGEKIGLIFQIKDDEMGIFGSEAETGKGVGSDIRENTKTIFRYYLYDKASNVERDFLDSVFGNSNLTEELINKIRRLLKDKKILSKVYRQIDALNKEAHEILSKIEIQSDYKEILFDLIEYNLKRSK